MTVTEPEPTVERASLLSKIVVTSGEIDATKRTLDDLMSERRRLFRAARAVGATQKQIAVAAGITEMAVSLAVRKDRGPTRDA